MPYNKVVTSCLTFLIINLFFTQGYSQCTYEFKVSSRTEKAMGIIDVNIKVSGAFSIELYHEKGIERNLIQTKPGVGNEKITFEGLITQGVYRVAIVVSSERDFLCKKKMSEEISFDIN
jgi:hypothetical protein